MKRKIGIIITIIVVTIILLSITLPDNINQNNTRIQDREKAKKNKESSDKSCILPSWKNGDYHNYQKTTNTIQRYNKRYPEIIDYFSIGKSVLGKDIWCIRITNESKTNDKYSCVIDGCIHGSEWEAGEACLYLIEYLIINYDTNSSIKKIIDETEIYIIPLLNPDGRDKDIRFNENGIDLNRNFDSHFGRLKAKNFRLGKLFGIFKIPVIKLPNGVQLTNAGRRPFSEPETKALKDFMEKLDEEKLSFYLNCHTAVHIIAGPYHVEHRPEFQLSENERHIINTVLEWVDENSEYEARYLENTESYGIGCASDWAYKRFQKPSFLFEILNLDYEPYYEGTGQHNKLVHWMKTTLPVFMYLLENVEYLNNWEEPIVQPCLPKGVPPEIIPRRSS